MRRNKKNRYGENLSETTVAHDHKVIKMIFNYGIKRGYLYRNPTNLLLDPPTPKTKERSFYNETEIQIALKKIKKEPLFFQTAIIVLFNSGLRRSELIGLKWKDIDFERNEISINKAMVQLDKLVEKETKTDRSKRRIVVVDHCTKILKKYKRYQNSIGLSTKRDEFVFKADAGKILSPGYLSHKWRVFQKQNKLKQITIHDIRHSHATYLLSLGINIKDVARRLGHSEISTTYNIYSHSSLIEDRKIANSIEENLYNKKL